MEHSDVNVIQIVRDVKVLKILFAIWGALLLYEYWNKILPKDENLNKQELPYKIRGENEDF